MDIESVLEEYLRGGNPDAIFIDIDGVMTVSRGRYELDLDVVKLLRDIVSLEIPVILVSGNAYPVVLTLQRYLGLPSIFVAENGCVIQLDKDLLKICKESLDPLVNEIAEKFCLKPSSSNMYRLCDRAFHIPKEVRESPALARELENRIMLAYPEIYAFYTGYVLHIYPRYCSKSSAIKLIAEKLGLDLGRCIAIGDSVTDIDMINTVGIGIATGDADEDLKKAARIVLPFRSSESTKFFLERLVHYIIKSKY